MELKLDNYIWQKYAEVLVDYSLNVQKGQYTVIRTDSMQALPLLKEIYKRVLYHGGYPAVKIGSAELNEIYIKNASDEQLEYVDPMTDTEYSKADNMISISAPFNLKSMAHLDSKKLAKRSAVLKSLTEKMLSRSAAGDLNWVIANFPTHALAQEANMSLDDYTEFLIKACYLDLDDPVSKWLEMNRKQSKIADYLNTKTRLRIIGEKTELMLNVKDRKWFSCAGRQNFPDGEIYTSPFEYSANGQIFFDYPQIYQGNEARNVLLTLKNGKIVEAKADKGEEFLNNMLNTDEGARFIGEIAIGTNEMIQEVTGNILFDEKIGGSIHMAAGASYPQTGGKNVSGIHWDLIKNMKNGGKIYADEELIYSDGKILI